LLPGVAQFDASAQTSSDCVFNAAAACSTVSDVHAETDHLGEDVIFICWECKLHGTHNSERVTLIN